MPGVSQRELRNLGININTTQTSTMSGTGTNTVTETFSLNPYACNINPGTDAGGKLYLKATESNSAEKKITMSIENGHNIKSTLESYSSKYAWGLLLGRIADDNGVYRDVIKNYKNLTKENTSVKRENKIFKVQINQSQRRIKQLKNTLKKYSDGMMPTKLKEKIGMKIIVKN